MKTLTIKKWTPEAKAYLIENFAAGNLEDICNHLGKNIGAINKKAHSLGLSRSKEARKWVGVWAADEDSLLKKVFPKTDNEVIAAQLNKTESAVRNRAVILKLKKSKHYWKIGQEKYVMENYGNAPMDDMVKHLKRTKWSVINKYRELTGLRKTGDKTIISKVINNKPSA